MYTEFTRPMNGRYSPSSMTVDWSLHHQYIPPYSAVPHNGAPPMSSLNNSMADESFADTDTEDMRSSTDKYYPEVSEFISIPPIRNSPSGKKFFHTNSNVHNISRAPSNDSNDIPQQEQDSSAQQPSHTQEFRPITNHQNTTFKCRQLPCRTFISTGSCPYGDRCVFLHDPSIVSKPVYIKTKRKSKDDQSTDAFFWPTMSLNSVMGKLDGKNMPHVAQHYIVPTPSSYHNNSTTNNDMAVFSMWEHFLDFCKTDSLSIVSITRNVQTNNCYLLHNPYTGKKRLPIFVQLSMSNSVKTVIDNAIATAPSSMGNMLPSAMVMAMNYDYAIILPTA